MRIFEDSRIFDYRTIVEKKYKRIGKQDFYERTKR